MRLKSRLDRIEAQLAITGEEIAASVQNMTPEARVALKRRLEAQIEGELLGTRGQASELRRHKRALTLAVIEREKPL